jgi:hypothetical protein
MDFHMLMLKETTTQEPHQWILMPQFGKEKKSMMVRYMEKKNTKKMQMIFKHMEKSKRLLQIQDFHINQQLNIPKINQQEFIHQLRCQMLFNQRRLKLIQQS